MKRENKIQEGETYVYPLPFGLKSLERKTSRQGGGTVTAFPEGAFIVQLWAEGAENNHLQTTQNTYFQVKTITERNTSLELLVHVTQTHWIWKRGTIREITFIVKNILISTLQLHFC